MPDDVPEWSPPPDLRRDASGKVPFPAAIAASGLASSTSDARRLIQGKGVRVDGVVTSDVNLGMGPGTYVVQVGKAKAARWKILD